MIRSLSTIAAVALLSWALASLQDAKGQPERQANAVVPTTWVRTVDGWEYGNSLWVEPSTSAVPSIHPLLIAGFQLSASLFVLIAFPSKMQGKS